MVICWFSDKGALFSIKNIYMTEADLCHSETMLNALVVWPSLQCTLNAVCGETRGLTFFPGEEQLLSMTTQLKNNDAGHDERSHYKADAILRCLNKKTGSNMELVLLETSNACNTASINDLEQAHKMRMREFRFKKLPQNQDLSCLVNPSISKITEHVHAYYFINDGPDSSPLAPLFP